MMRFVAFTLFFLSSAASFAQGRIIVWLNPNVTPESLTQLFPVNLLDTTADAPFAYYEARQGFDPHVIEDDMKASGLVTLAEDDDEVESPENQGAGKGGTIAAIFDPGAMRNKNDHVLKQINWVFRPLSIFDRPVRIGILDTGMPATNLYMRSRVVAALPVATDRPDWFDRPSGANTNGNGTPDDAVGHGSMVSGIIASMAPFSQFVVARVADSDGTASAWTVLKGLAFCCTHGAEVVNISLGAVNDIVALKDIIESWVDPQGVLIVSPIGNNSIPEANSPSRYGQVVCVSGVDPQDVKAPFSNWDSRASQAAPATGIVSTWWDNTMGIWSGTSFAGPFISGTIVDALRSRPTRFNSSAQLNLFRTMIAQTGDDIDPLNPQYTGKLGRRLNNGDLEKAVIGF